MLEGYSWFAALLGLLLVFRGAATGTDGALLVLGAIVGAAATATGAAVELRGRPSATVGTAAQRGQPGRQDSSSGRLT
jgi:hypothetical protein